MKTHKVFKESSAVSRSDRSKNRVQIRCDSVTESKFIFPSWARVCLVNEVVTAGGFSIVPGTSIF